ncbi:uncharacterized protein BYT42DRAFT_272403 [Radiomyces spectabilis]|uniref:uncharacterized protein n=1 Tax=Radiomyces spectabilis TaxID=64574 RepID=UPI00221FD7FF|nr:uncharacterized protein BYT42DRAFT_272403 [Radiomyces spectabilis]KAI8384732.1 hypothetical protein BYT42DRAFT_272403 [Radiomyces spectabilis]
MAKFNIDTERILEQRLTQIHARRVELDKEKSEIAFDLEIWEQADTELQEKLDEAVHDELLKKRDLTIKVEAIEEEIRQLVERLNHLENQRNEHRSEIHRLNDIIDNASRTYAPEKEHHLAEREAIEKRKAHVDRITTELDKEDTDLHQLMDRKHKDQQQYDDEMQELNTCFQHSMKLIDQTEQESKDIVSLFEQAIKIRDETILDETLAKSRSQTDAQLRENLLNHLQDNVENAQQDLDAFEEKHLHMKSQLASTEQKKQSAVQSGRFQEAARLAVQLKEIRSVLDQADSRRQKHKEALARHQETLEEHQTEMKQVETNQEQTQHYQSLFSQLES